MARLEANAVKRATPLERIIPELLGLVPITAGRELKVRCPFHTDSVPSLRINPAKQTWFCDPCQIGGDVFDFVKKLRGGVAFADKLAFLADRAGVPPAASATPMPAVIDTTYAYRDEQGTVLYETVRYKPKTFRQRRPSGEGSWLWNLDGVRRVVYRLPDLQGREAIYICEGEKDCEALWARRVPATTNVGGAGKWRPDYAAQLYAVGVKRVAVIPDEDDSGRAHADAVARSCLAAGLQVRIVTLPGVPPKGDVSDYLAAHPLDDLRALTRVSPVYMPTVDPVPAPREAADTGSLLSTSSRTKRRSQGAELLFDEPEPWPEAVDGASLLAAIAAFLMRFIVFADPVYADALALWIVHTYVMDTWWISPLAVVNSPTMRCGKSTLLMVVSRLVARALPVSNASAAALFRTIHEHAPTLLLDEAETFMKESEEIRGIVNASHTRDIARVIRTVGDHHEPRYFSTWCAKFICLIGNLPPTLMDRALVFPMQRKRTGDTVERIRGDRFPAQCLPLRRQIIRWVDDHRTVIQRADPNVPPSLDDRAADNSRPLLTIADVAGGDWPARARAAIVSLQSESRTKDLSFGLELLTDLRQLLQDEPETENVWASATLVERLLELDASPWATYGKTGKGLSTNALARLLKEFQVFPSGTVRVGAKTFKGYRRNSFEDAWDRYLPPSQPSHGNKPNKTGPELAISNRHIEIECDRCACVTNPIKPAHCDGVTVAEGGKGVSEDLAALPEGLFPPREEPNRPFPPLKQEAQARERTRF